MPKQAKRNKTGLPLRSIRSTPKRTTTTAKRTTTRDDAHATAWRS
jgi:hypothetical protein